MDLMHGHVPQSNYRYNHTDINAIVIRNTIYAYASNMLSHTGPINSIISRIRDDKGCSS